jgi:hypothetical protein
MNTAIPSSGLHWWFSEMANDERDQLTNFELQKNHKEILLVQGKVSLTALNYFQFHKSALTSV